MDGDRPHHHDGTPAEHGHEHFGPADAAAMATRDGVRATWLSLGILAATALLQLAIYLASGSVALLADTIHNLRTRSPRSRCSSRSGWAAGPRPAATPTAITGPRTSPGSRSWP